MGYVKLAVLLASTLILISLLVWPAYRPVRLALLRLLVSVVSLQIVSSSALPVSVASSLVFPVRPASQSVRPAILLRLCRTSTKITVSLTVLRLSIMTPLSTVRSVLLPATLAAEQEISHALRV